MAASAAVFASSLYQICSYFTVLFSSNRARLLLVGFSVMRLRCSCDSAAMRSVNHFVNYWRNDSLLERWIPSFVASCRARRKSMSSQFRGRHKHFEAGRHTVGHAATFQGRHICMLHFGAKLVIRWLREGPIGPIGPISPLDLLVTADRSV